MDAMRPLRAALFLVVLGTLAAAGCGSTSPTGPATAAATPAAQEPEPDCAAPGDSMLVAPVERYWPPEQGRVGVSFHGYAGIYRLPADHPCLSRWMALLEQSLQHGHHVRIAIDVGEQQIVSVTAAALGEEAAGSVSEGEAGGPSAVAAEEQ